MESVNEHSMRNAIQQLPQHRAGNHVWEEIRWQLDKPLSASLPLHNAPETAWKGITGSLTASVRNKVAGISALAILLLVITAIVFYPVKLHETNPTSEEVKHETRVTFMETAADQAIQAENRIVSTKPEQSDNPVLVNSIQNYTSLTSANQPLVPELPDIPYMKNSPGNPSEFIQKLQPTGQKYIAGFYQNDYVTIRNKYDRSFDDCATFHEVNTSVFMVADFEPEFFEIRGLNSPVYNFSVSSGYRHNRLSLTLGAGYTRINGTSQLKYEYRTNELIYSYNYVDSVYVDPVTHETYYFTVKVDVYDSIDHASEEKVFDRFSYLQVPLALSYELMNFRKLSLHLQFAGTYHHLQENTRNYKPFAEASSRLISTTMEEDKTGTNYWSAGAGLMLMYEPGYRLGISLTPRLKYNSLPVKSNSEKGFVSYGINFGLFYKIISDK